MKNRKLFLGVALMAAISAAAAPLTPEEALDRVAGNSGPLRVSSLGKTSPILKKTFKTGEIPSLYVFDNAGNHGFMVVSADDELVPILGYSDNGSFDEENMAPALSYWLNEYNRQIEFIRSQNLKPESSGAPFRVSLPSSWTAIEPLVKTQWNQDSPYNTKCPKIGSSYCFTGCVATSMSQIMKYWNYPEKGTGLIQYTPRGFSNRLQLNLNNTLFDWDNMLNQYLQGQYNTTQSNAVATLMMAAGYSVSMDYSTDQSGALSARIPGAFINYFNYDKGIRYYDRSDYSYETWAGMLYDNLTKKQPVIYDGSAPEGGHSFVLDGYDGNGYFHINWGWGGSSDGYFLLDALSPSSIGIGGAAGGFNFDQDCVMYIKPAEKGNEGVEQKDMFLYGSLAGNISGTTLSLYAIAGLYQGFGYQGNGSSIFAIGAAVTKLNDSASTPVYVMDMAGYYQAIPATYINASSPASPNAPKINLSDINMETGVPYKFTVSYKPEEGDWIEMTADKGSYNYVVVTKNSNSSYSVEYFPPMQFTASGISFNSEVYANNSVMVSAKLTNDNDIELSRGVQLLLLDASGKAAFTGDPVLLTLSADETKTLDWISSLIAAANVNITKDTDFYPALIDQETSVIYYRSSTPVTVKPSPAVSYNFNIAIEDAPSTSSNSGIMYTVENGNNFNVTSSMKITSGYFTSQITLHIMKPSGMYLYSQISFPYNVKFLNAGESADFRVNCNYPNATLNTTYYLVGQAQINGQPGWLTANNGSNVMFRITGFGDSDPGAGVETIVSEDSEILFIRDEVSRLSIIGGQDGIAAVTAYTLNGASAPLQVVINNGQATADLSALAKGIYILKATDRNGNTKSVKLAL